MRDLLKKPAVAVVLVVVLVGVAAFFAWRGTGGGQTAVLAGEVVIKDRETGETWKMLRGVLEKQLYERAHPIDPNVGVNNPTTGKPTGFTDDWEQLVSRINAEVAAVRANNPTP